MSSFMTSMRPQGLYDPWYEHDSCGVGFVVNVKGERSHYLVRQALEVLGNLEHRGAVGCDPDTGDGAGILMQLPHEFFAEECAEESISLPEPGQYAVAMVFFPRSRQERHRCERLAEQIIGEHGLVFLGWRTVPTNNSMLGEGALYLEPVIRQLFVRRPKGMADDLEFERRLYVCRRNLVNRVKAMGPLQEETFYICSFSARTLVYKGMLTPHQLPEYYLDLRHPQIKTALALVHSRFSTNTFPNWVRAHPYRFIAHNGEINTLRGNVNWMHARQALLAKRVQGEDWAKILPVIDEKGSDSSMFDNCLEFLHLSGRSLPHAIMMMIPEPWLRHRQMSEEKKAFYEYHASLMEPWDGPAAIAFTDGVRIGAVLDRNGLRPSRYYVTDDDLVILASEAGVLPIAPKRIVRKGRLQPGRMFLVDTEKGRIVPDEEIKEEIFRAHPYRQWLDEHLLKIEDLPAAPSRRIPETATLLQRQQSFGYSFEDLRMVLAPMAANGIEAVGSMGNDAPLAVLSRQPQLLYSYFKQLFAQVTNPPIDSIREEIVTSTRLTLGAERNLIHPEPESCRQLRLPMPIIDNDDLEKLRRLDLPGLKAQTLPILFLAADRGNGLENALSELCWRADHAIAEGVSVLILSDRGMNADKAPIPALLAVAALHHHLIRKGTRTLVGLAVESGEPRDTHHYSLLIGYGAGAINPYLVFESLEEMIGKGLLPGIDYAAAVKNTIKAATKGVVKTMAKMGISTMQSYRGAQIFEAVGLSREVIDTCFTWTASRIGGIGLDTIADEVLVRHRHAFALRRDPDEGLVPGGRHQWRQGAEAHQLGPMTMHLVQEACRRGDYRLFKEFSAHADDRDRLTASLRALLDFRFPAAPLPLEEVEPIESIVRRFKTGGMSYGSISLEAHEALAIAMNRLGGKSNSGEGGEDSARYLRDASGDSRSSAIKQVASGRFGVTSHYLINARELQIKMAQGAKPGEGGQLPGAKVYPPIARVRHSTPGVGLISPPPHHDIYSIEDLAELIHDLKNANPEARVSVKLVAEVGVGTIAAGVAKAKADVVLISGHDGGTGASPLTSIHCSGLPWELGLAETHQTLLLNGLRDRILVETDGQLKTGRDVVIAALLGAEEFGFATTPLVVLGCIMMRACHLNTCPVGIATQDPQLRHKFKGSPDHVVNYFNFVAQEVREFMARLGVRTFDELVGRSDLLEKRSDLAGKLRNIDLSRILFRPEVPPEAGATCRRKQEHNLHKSLDRTVLLKLCEPTLEGGEPARATLPIRNVNRVVGTLLGSELTRRFGPAGLPDDTVRLRFHGSAGQSFGAFVPRGMTLTVEGDANDYCGKGLSGGRIILLPPRTSTFDPQENIIVGNVAFYGATGGEAFIRGMAGERFCVRNSGLTAVVEAVGDHGCEYMTGGKVVILGPTGRNFAAGMSGGIAYVYDEHGTFAEVCNPEMVDLVRLEGAKEIEEVRVLIERHQHYTGSQRGAALLADWQGCVARFIKVLPRDYQRMLAAIVRAEEAGLSGEEALAAAFAANAADLSRVGGN
jgi:glutamate synthase domain-containing protein 2/glutamate synthase domain-containing protein 1/glutamate synthase domain-containing protein 3